MNAMLSQIYSAVGARAVLLPVRRGEKKPARVAWQKTTFADTQEPDYQEELARSDVGVLLGSAGGGVCTVDCDTDAAADSFVAANPIAAGTLRTRGARGCNFWFRVRGQIPRGCKLMLGDEAVGEWRADGNQTKIAGLHPGTGRDYEWVVDAPAVEIAFDDIAWPAGWTGECIKTDFDRLVEEYGAPYAASKRSVSLNQTFFAARFAAENGLLFEPDENRFYLYEPERGLWAHTTEARIKTLVLDSIMDFARTQETTVRGHLELVRTDQTGGNLVRLLRGLVERRGVFTTPRRIVHVLNGVVEIAPDKVTLRPFSPDYYSRNQIPVSFAPDASCPRFLDELLAAAVPAEDASLLQKWIGNVLLGGNPAQVMLIQEGLAGTGKSTVASVFEALLGADSVVQLRTELLHERFEIARFIGKRLLAGRDVPGDFLNRRGASALKSITGNDTLSAEVKGTMTAPTVHGLDVIVTANSRLRVRLEGDTDAWRRRLLIVSYRRPRPAKPIPDFARTLFQTEGAGILNWALAGACSVLRDLESGGRVVLSNEQHRRVDALLAESDSLRAFIRECVRLSPGDSATTDELTEAYSRFCDRMDWTPVSLQDAQRDLPDLMLSAFGLSRRNDVKREGKARKGYLGVAIHEPAADAA